MSKLLPVNEHPVERAARVAPGPGLISAAAVEAHVSARVLALIKQQGHGQDLDPAVASRLNNRLRDLGP